MLGLDADNRFGKPAKLAIIATLLDVRTGGLNNVPNDLREEWKDLLLNEYPRTWEWNTNG